MIHDLRFCLVLVLLFLAGCNPPQANVPKPAAQRAAREDGSQEADRAVVTNPQSAIRNPPLPPGFTPVKIAIVPLTELSNPSGADRSGRLSVFVALLDAFGSQMKAPGILRFELYEHIPRSAQSKGPRLALWPDIDLTSPAQNNVYWRDFLRAYEFVLDTQASRDKTYILEATCLCPDGRRLSGEYVLKDSP